MNSAVKLLCGVIVLTPLVVGGLVLDQHRDWLREQLSSAVATASVGTGSAPPSASKPAGRHGITESPPVTVPDLDRLVGVGFTADQIVSEIARRGVLHLPEPAERDHIQRLPSGSRLLDAMDSPQNLIDDTAAADYGRRQANAQYNDQFLAASQSMVVRAATFQPQAQINSAQQQMYADYQRRFRALSAQITGLNRKRAAMQQQGESTIAIGMEIERLERERAALVSPL